MEHSKKFILVSRENLEKLEEGIGQRKRHTVQTPGTETSRIDGEMRDILDLKTVDDSEKWKMFQQALLRFLNAKRSDHVQSAEVVESQQPENLLEEAGTSGISEDGVLVTVPGKYKTKARLLFKTLKNLPRSTFSWDDKGLVTINGQVVERSNIVDLINEAMRSRKTSNPPGRHQFAVLLRSLNIPREYVGNKDLWSLASPPSKKNTLTVPALFKAGSDSDASLRPASSVPDSSESDEYQSGSGRKRLVWSRLRK